MTDTFTRQVWLTTLLQEMANYFNYELDRAKLKLYIDALLPYSEKQTERAMVELSNEARRFPMIADVRERIQSFPRPTAPVLPEPDYAPKSKPELIHRALHKVILLHQLGNVGGICNPETETERAIMKAAWIDGLEFKPKDEDETLKPLETTADFERRRLAFLKRNGYEIGGRL
jgi:hypothetical protein